MSDATCLIPAAVTVVSILATWYVSKSEYVSGATGCGTVAAAFVGLLATGVAWLIWGLVG